MCSPGRPSDTRWRCCPGNAGAAGRGPECGSQTTARGPEGAQGGLCARVLRAARCLNGGKKVVQSCVFPESPYFFLFFHRPGFYGARKLLSQPGEEAHGAFPGLGVLLKQGYLLGLEKPLCWNLLRVAGSAPACAQLRPRAWLLRGRGHFWGCPCSSSPGSWVTGGPERVRAWTCADVRPRCAPGFLCACPVKEPGFGGALPCASMSCCCYGRKPPTLGRSETLPGPGAGLGCVPNAAHTGTEARRSPAGRGRGREQSVERPCVSAVEAPEAWGMRSLLAASSLTAEAPPAPLL